MKFTFTFTFTNICNNKRQQVFAELVITEAGLNSQLNPLFVQTDMRYDTEHIYPTAGSKIDKETGSVNIYFR
jgi:hypothetical protein